MKSEADCAEAASPFLAGKPGLLSFFLKPAALDLNPTESHEEALSPQTFALPLQRFGPGPLVALRQLEEKIRINTGVGPKHLRIKAPLSKSQFQARAKTRKTFSPSV